MLQFVAEQAKPRLKIANGSLPPITGAPAGPSHRETAHVSDSRSNRERRHPNGPNDPRPERGSEESGVRSILQNEIPIWIQMCVRPRLARVRNVCRAASQLALFSEEELQIY